MITLYAFGLVLISSAIILGRRDPRNRAPSGLECRARSSISNNDQVTCDRAMCEVIRSAANRGAPRLRRGSVVERVKPGLGSIPRNLDTGPSHRSQTRDHQMGLTIINQGSSTGSRCRIVLQIQQRSPSHFLIYCLERSAPSQALLRGPRWISSGKVDVEPKTSCRMSNSLAANCNVESSVAGNRNYPTRRNRTTYDRGLGGSIGRGDKQIPKGRQKIEMS